MLKITDLTNSHDPVLVDEVNQAFGLEELAHSKDKVRIIDATLGLGGHSIEFCKKGAEVLGIEIDDEFLEIAGERLKEACPLPDSVRKLYKVVKGNFKDIDKIAKSEEFIPVDGIIFDLGVSTSQLTSSIRGMTFSNPDSRLDMRLDRKNQQVSASDLLNSLPQEHLSTIFSKVLNKGEANRLSRQIIKYRQSLKFETVSDFLNVLRSAGFKKKSKLHFATKPFLALRMAVNSELENLREALPKALKILKKRGRLIVISFHSGEDSIVKSFGKSMKIKGEIELINKKPIVPSRLEIINNPRSRSAKMRIMEKI